MIVAASVDSNFLGVFLPMQKVGFLFGRALPRDDLFFPLFFVENLSDSGFHLKVGDPTGLGERVHVEKGKGVDKIIIEMLKMLVLSNFLFFVEL